MKIHLLFFCLLLISRLDVPAQQNTSDGPYVFYKDDSVTVQSIFNGTVRTESFLEEQKSKHLLAVHFSDHPDWDFTVTIKAKIKDEDCVFPGADKLIAFSDIEGEFGPFREMLIKNHVTDEHYRWIFGKGVLVIAGDLFDRGKDVAAYIWLLYKLEVEARAAGGYMHIVLGNHEIMNLSGDTRYVEKRYFDNAQLMGKEYTDFYTRDTELGRWLRSKNIVEKIGDVLILHGGISQAVNNLGIELFDINQSCRPYYDGSMQKENFTDDKIWTFFDDRTSPFWYRGYFLDPKASMAQVDSTLALYQCGHIIVGHDITDHISTLYNNKVIGIDVNEHDGQAEGLLIENGVYFRIDRTGNKTRLF